MSTTIEILQPPTGAELVVGALRLLIREPTGDANSDCNTALSSNYPLGGTKPARLNVGGLVVKGAHAEFSYAYDASFLAQAGAVFTERGVVKEVLEGLDVPTVLIVFSNATHNAANLRVTFDRRRAWLNMPGGAVMFNALKIRSAANGGEPISPGSNESRVVKQLHIKMPKKGGIK